ncbi:MAG: ABC transporter permease [Clostridia bacterium]|nr:ABC transporter permease [Clostridia bacterium]
MEKFKKPSIITKIQEQGFLFSELVKRDFKKKYKRTYLGMLWSILSPLLTLLVMSLVFKNFFGRDIPHYTIYLFCGNIVFSFFSDATNGGMGSLLGNAAIFSKVNVPKYLFLFSRNVSSLINFGLTLGVFFIFCIIDGITFTWGFFMLIIPIICLIIFNLGVGLILSALFVFFRDVQYLWSVFTMLLMYMSAIFYVVDENTFGAYVKLFLINPIYVYIKYFRIIVIDNALPSLQYNLLAVFYALAAFGVGALIYKKCNHKFLYYI